MKMYEKTKLQSEHTCFKELRRVYCNKQPAKKKEKKSVYLVGAVDRDDVGLHLGLSLFRDAFVRGRRLNKKTLS